MREWRLDPPGHFKRSPRGVQEEPKRSPKGPQEEPKRTSRGPQEDPTCWSVFANVEFTLTCSVQVTCISVPTLICSALSKLDLNDNYSRRARAARAFLGISPTPLPSITASYTSVACAPVAAMPRAGAAVSAAEELPAGQAGGPPQPARDAQPDQGDQIAVPPYQEGDCLGEAKCYMCDKYQVKTWSALLQHLRKVHKVKQGQVSGTWLHTQAREETRVKERTWYEKNMKGKPKPEQDLRGYNNVTPECVNPEK